jgi:hypothetical protein
MKNITVGNFNILAASGAISNLAIKPLEGKWILRFSVGIEEALLHTQKGEIRTFTKVDTLIAFLVEAGVSGATIKFN